MVSSPSDALAAVAVFADGQDDATRARAARLAERLALSVVDKAVGGYDLLLAVTDERMLGGQALEVESRSLGARPVTTETELLKELQPGSLGAGRGGLDVLCRQVPHVGPREHSDTEHTGERRPRSRYLAHA